MSKLFSLFHRNEHSIPDFSDKANALRSYLDGMGTKEKVEALINVSKVWTYDYDERKAFMQELFDGLPPKVQELLTDLLRECVPGQDVTQDIPLALSAIKKEKLLEFASSIA